MTHEDTLNAITFVCDRLEQTMFERSNRWEGDTGHACVTCGKRIVLHEHDEYGKAATPEDERHEPDCELVAKVRMLRAFVRVEGSIAPTPPASAGTVRVPKKHWGHCRSLRGNFRCDCDGSAPVDASAGTGTREGADEDLEAWTESVCPKCGAKIGDHLVGSKAHGMVCPDPTALAASPPQPSPPPDKEREGQAPEVYLPRVFVSEDYAPGGGLVAYSDRPHNKRCREYVRADLHDAGRAGKT